MPKVFDCFPFFGGRGEEDVLDIRLHELSPIVDKFIIVESCETYGGTPKPLNLQNNWDRYREFWDKIVYVVLPKLEPACMDRMSGRLREAYQRNQIWGYLERMAYDTDVVIFSDVDEIPRCSAVKDALNWLWRVGILRLKQKSYYYHTGCLVDYGHDFASRARIGFWYDIKEFCPDMYAFRNFQKETCPAIENGGWHFSYFGDIPQIKTKVAALSPFLEEYRLFGDKQLETDILDCHDLHHRHQVPDEMFSHIDDGDLPEYLLANPEKFVHFSEKYFQDAYASPFLVRP